MRDPKRIDYVLHVIEVIWKQALDLRLMQLLQNVLGHGDNYNVEDEVLIEKVRKFYSDIGLKDV